jgi:hypothetical protein
MPETLAGSNPILATVSRNLPDKPDTFQIIKKKRKRLEKFRKPLVCLAVRHIQ